MMQSAFARLGVRTVVLISFALLAAGGCRRTRLTINFASEGPVGGDFTRLFALTDAPETTVTSDAGKMEVRFETDPALRTRQRLMEALDKMKGVEHRRPGPLLVWRLTETDPAVLKILGLDKPESREAPIKLQVREGRSALKIRRTAMDAMVHSAGNQICSYDIPLEDALPAVGYGVSISESAKAEVSKLSPELRRSMKALVSKLNDLEPDAASQIVSLDPELAPLTKDMVLEDRRKLSIVFGTGKKIYADPVLLTAPDQDFVECHDQILSGSDAFVRDLLFPDISGRIKDYNFEQTFF